MRNVELLTVRLDVVYFHSDYKKDIEICFSRRRNLFGYSQN